MEINQHGALRVAKGIGQDFLKSVSCPGTGVAAEIDAVRVTILSC